MSEIRKFLPFFDMIRQPNGDCQYVMHVMQSSLLKPLEVETSSGFMTVLGTAKPPVLGTEKPLILGIRKPQFG